MTHQMRDKDIYLKGMRMLIIKTDNHGTYWIELNGECIHGALTKQTALIYLKSYQKIWDAGYMAAEENDR